MNAKYHIIKNFKKKKTKFLIKLIINVEFLVSTTNIKFRNNWLTSKDYQKSKKYLKKGYIILVGTYKKLSHLIIKGEVTHSLIYYKDEKLIHAMADGVEYISLDKLFDFYDVFKIIRPKINDDKKIDEILKFAENQIGKPYNFSFKYSNHKTYFCTQLINDAFHKVGFHTNLKDHDNKHKPLLPEKFLKSDQFELIYSS